MALLPIHNYFVYNNTVVDVSEFVPSENEGGIYEVLRVIDGVPLFLEEHLERLNRSAILAQKTIPYSEKKITDFLVKLIESNKVFEGNILLSFKENLKAFFLAHRYPDSNLYEKGVCCGVLHAERNNPNAKVFQTNVRQEANRLIAENNFFEVLLVDQYGRITEGSRSNVFFIKNDCIITPSAKSVLLGITRKKTMLCANEIGYQVKQEDIYCKDLANFDAVFITGTSPKILPLGQVGECAFSVENKILRKLMSQYDRKIQNYISLHKKNGNN